MDVKDKTLDSPGYKDLVNNIAVWCGDLVQKAPLCHVCLTLSFPPFDKKKKKTPVLRYCCRALNPRITLLDNYDLVKLLPLQSYDEPLRDSKCLIGRLGPA